MDYSLSIINYSIVCSVCVMILVASNSCYKVNCFDWFYYCAVGKLVQRMFWTYLRMDPSWRTTKLAYFTSAQRLVVKAFLRTTVYAQSIYLSWYVCKKLYFPRTCKYWKLYWMTSVCASMPTNLHVNSWLYREVSFVQNLISYKVIISAV